MKKVRRSRPYPYYTISVALGVAEDVESLGGYNVSEHTLADKWNIKNTKTRSFAGKVSSAKHFGLLAGEGRLLSLTERALLILRPKDDEVKKELLREAFLVPELYRGLYDKFKGKNLPALKTLANILFHDYGINPNVSKGAAKSFADSAKFVGLLSEEGCLSNVEEDEGKEEEGGEEESGGEDLLKDKTHEEHDSDREPTKDIITASIELSKGVATVRLPKGGLTKRDKKRLLAILDVYVYVPEEEHESEDEHIQE